MLRDSRDSLPIGGIGALRMNPIVPSSSPRYALNSVQTCSGSVGLPHTNSPRQSSLLLIDLVASLHRRLSCWLYDLAPPPACSLRLCSPRHDQPDLAQPPAATTMPRVPLPAQRFQTSVWGPSASLQFALLFRRQQTDSRRAVFAGLSTAGSISRQRKPSSTDNLCLEEGGGDNGCSGMPAPGSAAGKRLQNHRNVVLRMQNMVADRRRRNVRFV